MTTQAQVRSAWQISVFNNPTIQAITPKIYPYDVTKQSTKEILKFRYNQEVNFITYIVKRSQQMMIMGQIAQAFEVELSYYKVADTDGVNFNSVLDFFESLDTIVISGLGQTWGGIIDYYQTQEQSIEIEQIDLEGEAIWLGRYKYIGFKKI